MHYCAVNTRPHPLLTVQKKDYTAFERQNGIFDAPALQVGTFRISPLFVYHHFAYSHAVYSLGSAR